MGHWGSLYDVTSCLAVWSHVHSGGFLSVAPCSFQGVSIQGGLCPGGGSLSGRPPYSEERAVCILLECILVCECFCIYHERNNCTVIVALWKATYFVCYLTFQQVAEVACADSNGQYRHCREFLLLLEQYVLCILHIWVYISCIFFKMFHPWPGEEILRSSNSIFSCH